MSLTQLGSHHAKIIKEGYKFPRFAVLSDGTVVVYGREYSAQFAPAFHCFRASAAEWTKLKQLPRLCEHGEWTCFLFPVKIGNQELLAVSCSGCEVIQLLDLETGESTTAFEHPQFRPGYMCKGERGQMFVDTFEKEMQKDVVLLLDCSTAEFRVMKCIIADELSDLECYMPKHKLLVTCGDNQVDAISSEDGKRDWNLKLDCYIPCAKYSAELDAVFVGSYKNQEVHVVNASDGVLRETIQLPEEVGWVRNMRFHNGQLILYFGHEAENEENVKFGYFSLQ